jgi:hypothetical protein
MAKKSRRTRNTPRLSASQLVGTDGGPVAEAPAAGGGAAVARRPEGPRGSLAREDYSHVIGDLRRIAVLAGTFFTIMIVLSFVLPQILK